MSFHLRCEPSEAVKRAMTAEDQDRFNAVVDKRGRKAEQERRRLYAAYPDLALAVADLAVFTERAIVDAHYGGCVFPETLPVRCEAMRRELSRPGDGKLEELVVERVVATWLHLQAMEHRRAAEWSKGSALRCLAFYDREVSRANADHLKALKTLAQVRKLLRPTVAQMNVAMPGSQQANAVLAGERP